MKSFLTISIVLFLCSCRKDDSITAQVPIDHDTPAVSNYTTFSLSMMDSLDRTKPWAAEVVTDKNTTDNYSLGDTSPNFPQTGCVLFLGNSLFNEFVYSYFYTTAFSGIPVVNRALGGSLLKHTTSFTKYIVDPYKPSVIVLYGGENELQANYPAYQTFNDLRTLVLKIRQTNPNVKIVILSEQLCPVYASKKSTIIEYNRMAKSFTDTLVNSVYVDVYSAGVDSSGDVLDPTEFKADGKHFLQKGSGYVRWTKLIKPHLNTSVPASPVTLPSTQEIPPITNAGLDLNFSTSLMKVYNPTLNGTLSKDPDGYIKAFQWSQVSGPTVLIESPNSGKTKIIGLVEGIYMFRLTSTDNRNLTSYDDVQVTVK